MDRKGTRENPVPLTSTDGVSRTLRLFGSSKTSTTDPNSKHSRLVHTTKHTTVLPVDRWVEDEGSGRVVSSSPLSSAERERTQVPATEKAPKETLTPTAQSFLVGRLSTHAAHSSFLSGHPLLPRGLPPALDPSPDSTPRDDYGQSRCRERNLRRTPDLGLARFVRVPRDTGSPTETLVKNPVSGDPGDASVQPAFVDVTLDPIPDPPSLGSRRSLQSPTPMVEEGE